MTNRDPTRETMLAFVHDTAAAYGEIVDEFDCEEAIYWFASDYHGGQWSNLYAALCASPFKPGPMHSQPQSFDADFLYSELIAEFAP